MYHFNYMATIIRLLLLLAALSLGACASVKPSASAPPTQQLADAMKLVAANDFKGGEAALQTLIAAPTFHDLPREEQYRALATAGKVALAHGEPKVGYQYLVRALALPQATYEDRWVQLDASVRLRYPADTVVALTSLAQQWPDRVATLDSDFIVGTIRQANQLAPGAPLPLLWALYQAHWKYKGQTEPSGMWLDLALLLVEKGRLAEAIDVSARVDGVYELISMRVDPRFDAVVAGNPDHFDIEMAAARQLRALQLAAENSPRLLELRYALIEALRQQRHYAAALAAADSVLAETRSTNFPEKLYEDYLEMNNWFLNGRATALERVGRWDEAVAQLTAASLLPEHNTGNVSQLINLGELYCDLGRPNEALAAIGRQVAATSSWGAMEKEEVRFDAAVQIGDTKQAERSLQFLHDHREDAMRVYEDALIVANHLDEAAKVLIDRLLDPDQRLAALASVQSYAQAPSTPRIEDLRTRRRAMIARREVQAAIQKVGRVEKFKLEAQDSE